MTNDVTSSDFSTMEIHDANLSADCSIPCIPTVTTSPATQKSELRSEAIAIDESGKRTHKGLLLLTVP